MNWRVSALSLVATFAFTSGVASPPNTARSSASVVSITRTS
jgi:hypothetical protein